MKRTVSAILISSLSFYQFSSWNIGLNTNANKLLEVKKSLVQNSSLVTINSANQTVSNRASFEYGENESIFSNITELELVMDTERLTTTVFKHSPDDAKTNTYQWIFYIDFGQIPDNITKIKILDETDNQLEIVDVTITDQNNQDVSNNGSWRIEEQQLEFNLKKKNGSFSYLNQQTYRVVVTASTADTMKRIEKLYQIDQKLAVLENEISVQGGGHSSSQLGQSFEQFSGTPLLFGLKKGMII